MGSRIGRRTPRWAVSDSGAAPSQPRPCFLGFNRTDFFPIVYPYNGIRAVFVAKRKLLLKFGFLSKKTGASRAEIIVPTGLPNALVVFAHNDLLCGTLMVNYEEGSFGVIGLGVGVKHSLIVISLDFFWERCLLGLSIGGFGLDHQILTPHRSQASSHQETST
ncbi:hypothetical protein SO802_014179 [Lithocarpus litseifolius]|uniref:Peptidase A1 domain-containing protein n=1 Tax=Lithocarpus litseifolius TaxID=425828 RepID=A0AAW2CSH8_9ROSI